MDYTYEYQEREERALKVDLIFCGCLKVDLIFCGAI